MWVLPPCLRFVAMTAHNGHGCGTVLTTSRAQAQALHSVSSLQWAHADQSKQKAQFLWTIFAQAAQVSTGTSDLHYVHGSSAGGAAKFTWSQLLTAQNRYY